jgi:hypothetical protein
MPPKQREKHSQMSSLSGYLEPINEESIEESTIKNSTNRKSRSL